MENKKRIAWNKGLKINKEKYPQVGFRKGHKFYKGGEKGWFKKGDIPRNFKGGNSIQYRRKHSPIPEPEQCEICGAFGNDTKKKLCYDHDHKTG